MHAAPPACDASIARVVHLRLDVGEQVLRRWPDRKTALVSDFGNRRGDVGRDLADSRQRRIQAALLDVRFTHEIGQRVRGGP